MTPNLSAALLELARIGGEVAATEAVRFAADSITPKDEDFTDRLEAALRWECGQIARSALEALRDCPPASRVDRYLDQYRRAGIRAAKAALTGRKSW